MLQVNAVDQSDTDDNRKQCVAECMIWDQGQRSKEK